MNVGHTLNHSFHSGVFSLFESIIVNGPSALVVTAVIVSGLPDLGNACAT